MGSAKSGPFYYTLFYTCTGIPNWKERMINQWKRKRKLQLFCLVVIMIRRWLHILLQMVRQTMIIRLLFIIEHRKKMILKNIKKIDKKRIYLKKYLKKGLVVVQIK